MCNGYFFFNFKNPPIRTFNATVKTVIKIFIPESSLVIIQGVLLKSQN